MEHALAMGNSRKRIIADGSRDENNMNVLLDVNGARIKKIVEGRYTPFLTCSKPRNIK